MSLTARKAAKYLGKSSGLPNGACTSSSPEIFAGPGFATRLLDEGHRVLIATNPSETDQADPQRMESFSRIGCGLAPREPLARVMTRREEMRDWCWVWDANHSVDENEVLRAGGYRVLGDGRHPDGMEQDRQACVTFASRYGLKSPPSIPCSGADEAIRFCEKHPNTAYVYKPDEGAIRTPSCPIRKIQPKRTSNSVRI